MTQSSTDVTVRASVPDGLPLLSRGKHKNPARGACFMEFTSLLAGGPFTDDPRCVDRELAAVLRGANDKLSDADRHRLVPLLGRAISLAVEVPPPVSGSRRSAAVRRRRREQAVRYSEQTAQLRRSVSRRFMAELGASPSPTVRLWSAGGQELSWLFWDLMCEPIPLAGSDDYVTRLIDRLRLLHECYEQAMDELGLPRAVPAAARDRLPAAADVKSRGVPAR